MRKKWIIGFTGLALVIGIGTSVYAATSDDGGLFERMLPVAKQMHPNLTDEQIKEMFNSCQSSNGGRMQQMMK